MLKLSLIIVCCIAAIGCRQAREQPAAAPVYVADVEVLLEQHCTRCHSGEDAGAAFRTDGYLNTLGCPADRPGTSAVERDSDAGAPLLRVLTRDDHKRLLDASEVARLRAWVQAGAPLRERRVHAPGILNARSQDWHGKLAARDHFGPITRADHPDVCGRCHAGAPVAPPQVTRDAPGAPACTSCHDRPQGVLACGTCHGDGADDAEPPRDGCLFPNSQSGAHRAHLSSTRLALEPLSCATCHGELPAALGGSHGDGEVDVVFDPARAGQDAHYDPANGQCSVGCHNRGGARALPSFSETGPLGCGDCHASPPADHYAGSCDRCHRGVDANGGGLLELSAHMDGRSGPGDGPEACGACHGRADDPWPQSPSHQLHRDTTLTRSIACNECHRVPERPASEGHLDRAELTPADVQFGAGAHARGCSPEYSQRSCSDVACHGGGLPEQLDNRWTWDGMARVAACGGCHGIPPTVQHTPDTRCASPACHGTQVSVAAAPPAITASGRERHIDGRSDTTQR